MITQAMYVWWVALMLLIGVAPEQTDPPLEEADTVAILKASYLFKFATSNDWPAEAKTGPFKIGIYKHEGVFRELSAKYATKPIGSQALEVHLIEKPDDRSFYHIVYAPSKDGEALKKLASAAANGSTLMVSDGKDNLKKGAAITFVVVDNGTRYMINTDEAQRRKISIGSTILLWAISN